MPPNASFDDIVAAYESWTMADLMKTQGIDLSDLEAQGVTLRMPTVSEHAVFRLMTGVEHASGRHCMCFRMNQGRPCHRGFETHLDIQSDVCYGFYLSNSWERWQLLNFYKELFKLPNFDPREMAKQALIISKTCTKCEKLQFDILTVVYMGRLRVDLQLGNHSDNRGLLMHSTQIDQGIE
jgi:hypothetical protein